MNRRFCHAAPSLKIFFNQSDEMTARAKTDYNAIAGELLSRPGPPWPVYKHNYTSKKYRRYVYNVSIDGRKFWQARLNLEPFTWDGTRYFNTEAEAAGWIYTMIKKYLNRVKRLNKTYDNKTRDKHINWQVWLLNYQHQEHPRKICELIITKP